tara:strand:+ start:2007 stop:2639 length:633 start_codon:yes stop_codon:yes gene_type:complete
VHRNVTLNNVRFNWLTVLEPSAFKPGDPLRYRAEVLIEPDSEADKVLMDAIKSAAEEKWPGKSDGHVKSAQINRKVCRKLGTEMPPNKDTGELPSHYQDAVVLSTGRSFDRDGSLRVFCRRKSTGKLVEIDKDTTIDDDLVRPVPGNFGKVLVTIWGWEHSGAPQLNCTLESIAFTVEGDPLGSKAPLKTEAILDAFGEELEEGTNPFGE